jgi:DNA-binding transcriptional ArsR family regulator
MEARRDVFQAIADPTRRAIIDRLAMESVNMNSLADQFTMSRQAVSLHVKILEECGLLTIRQQGRERVCIASLQSLRQVSSWVDMYKKFWDQKLDALESYLKEVQSATKATKSTSVKVPPRSIKRKRKNPYGS